jgi:hypothetical protein
VVDSSPFTLGSGGSAAGRGDGVSKSMEIAWLGVSFLGSGVVFFEFSCKPRIQYKSTQAHLCLRTTSTPIATPLTWDTILAKSKYDVGEIVTVHSPLK